MEEGNFISVRASALSFGPPTSHPIFCLPNARVWTRQANSYHHCTARHTIPQTHTLSRVVDQGQTKGLRLEPDCTVCEWKNIPSRPV
jgi:hypothetical protein